MDDIINKIFLTKNCGKLIVLQKEKKQGNIWLYKCKFIKTGTIILARKSSIKQGNLIDYNCPSVYNKGYLGIGKYNEKIINKFI